MTLLAELRYFEVIREVKSIAQIDTEEERALKMYKDKIISKHHTFLMQDVMDMTFRNFGVKISLLYIYTRSGVFTFKIRQSPENFLHTYQALTKKI